MDAELKDSTNEAAEMTKPSSDDLFPSSTRRGGGDIKHYSQSSEGRGRSGRTLRSLPLTTPSAHIHRFVEARRHPSSVRRGIRDAPSSACALRPGALIVLVLLILTINASAHDIPNDVTVHAYMKPEGQHLRLLIR